MGPIGSDSNLPEIRQNKATREWVIYAPSRGRRPRDFRRSRPGRAEVPERDERCPFCPGNEAQLPPVILELPGPDASGWQTRVVPNKFPALCPELGTARACRGIYVVMPGSGRHEVVVESPSHSRQPAAMTARELEAVVETYHRRYSDLMALHGSMMAIFFRNHGEAAGTSLVHPHSQVIVTDLVPAPVRWREQTAQDHFDQWGRCVYCEILAFEVRERRRVVGENLSFVAFVPFAAEVPFEVWIMPRRHAADFGAVTDPEKADLASLLREVLGRLCCGLDDPDYNYVINTAARYRADEPQLHWYLRIRPRLTTPAGFELGSGISINPSVPEADAAFLRAVRDA